MKRFHLHSLPIALLFAALPSLAAAPAASPPTQPGGYAPPYGGFPYQPPQGGQPSQSAPAGYPPQPPGGWGYPPRQGYAQPAQPGYTQPAPPTGWQPSAQPSYQPPYQPSPQPPAYSQPGYAQPAAPTYSAPPAQPSYSQPGYGQPPASGFPFGQQPGFPQGGGAPQQPGYGQPTTQGFPAPQGFPGQQSFPSQQTFPGQPSSSALQPWTPPQQQQPSYGQPQGYGAPYGQAQQPQRAAPSQPPPKVELRMESNRAYVQQSILLTFDITSASELKTADVETPRASDLVFKRVGESVTPRGREFVNHIYVALTPLREGQFTLPPVKVKGAYASGAEFEAETPSALQLNVIPADPSLHPWLPLHGLVIQGYLQGDQNPAAGKPLSLVVDISAVGTTGQQLPSVEPQLKVPDFRVYKEKSETTGKVSQDGKHLIGNRTETFTLVPLHGGRVQVPTLRLNWFNVDTAQVEEAAVPIRQLMAKGEPGAEDGRVTDLFPGATRWILWPALIALFAVPIGIWTLAWLRHKTFIQVMGEEMSIAAGFFWSKAAGFLRWLAPIRRAQRLRQIFVRGLPKSWRLWFCVRLVNQENDPETWAYMLRFLANKHLGLPPQDSMTILGDRIATIHPKCNREVMRTLMAQLDAALYHRGEIDFPRWKRQFRAQLRPSIFGRSREPRPAPHRPRGLPQLNPQT